MTHDPKTFHPGTSFTAETIYSATPQRFLLLDDRETVVEQTGVERHIGVIDIYTIKDVYHPDE